MHTHAHQTQMDPTIQQQRSVSWLHSCNPIQFHKFCYTTSYECIQHNPWMFSFIILFAAIITSENLHLTLGAQWLWSVALDCWSLAWWLQYYYSWFCNCFPPPDKAMSLAIYTQYECDNVKYERETDSPALTQWATYITSTSRSLDTCHTHARWLSCRPPWKVKGWALASVMKVQWEMNPP